MKQIFFDCEFASFEDPKLISIGLVTEGDVTFYAEITDTWSKRDCSTFVLDTILPELRGGDASMTEAKCANRLTLWIEAMNEPVELACDSINYDQVIAEKLFEKYGWPSNLSRKIVWIDVDDFSFYQAANNVWDEHPEAIRHHALWDARCLMLAARLRNKYAFIV